jgi:hypothetical protein
VLILALFVVTTTFLPDFAWKKWHANCGVVVSFRGGGVFVVVTAFFGLLRSKQIDTIGS